MTELSETAVTPTELGGENSQEITTPTSSSLSSADAEVSKILEQRVQSDLQQEQELGKLNFEENDDKIVPIGDISSSILALQYLNQDEAIHQHQSSHDQQSQQFQSETGADGKITSTRRSTRDIKRPKFDDELVDSMTPTTKTITPRKRHFNERGTSVGATSNAEIIEEEGRLMRKKIKKPTQSQTSVLTQQQHQQIQAASITPDVPIPVVTQVNVSKLPQQVSKGGTVGPAERNVSRAVSEEDKRGGRKKSQKKKQPQQQPAQQQQPGQQKSKTHNPELMEAVSSLLNRPCAASMANFAESMKRWTADDDLALIAAATWVSDLQAVYNSMKFSKRYSLVEIEERWYELFYNEDASKTARRRMDNLSREKIRAIQSKIPFTIEEEEFIRSVPSAPTPARETFEKLLDDNYSKFHHARTAKVLEEHWRELKFFGFLVDQRPAVFDEDLLQVEKTLDLCSLVESDISDQLPLDVEERTFTRNVVVAERESQEWERVFAKAITGISMNAPMALDTIAVLRGRCITYDIRKNKLLIGRSTARHRVDVNLSLEGPSARISRKQALMKTFEDGEFLIHNIGQRPIYVDGCTVLKGEKTRLRNNSLIEIALIRLQFVKNENYVKKL